ncbi:hypothetical protein D3C79_1031960 [compost metagenome]
MYCVGEKAKRKVTLLESFPATLKEEPTGWKNSSLVLTFLLFKGNLKPKRLSSPLNRTTGLPSYDF